MSPVRKRLRYSMLIGLVVAVLVYLPGLSGSFVYDDFVFFVGNPAVHVDSLELSDWAAAANSFPAAHQGRWLGMLSFAANYYLGGLDPWGYKLFNLLVHLFNGWLLALMLGSLFKMRRQIHPVDWGPPERDAIYASSIATIWMILPINLTGVLYVGQRLESFSNTFVLLGLYLYITVRVRDWRMENVGIRPLLVLLGCTASGLLVKESAVLLPLYAGCIEFVLTRLKRADGSRSRSASLALGLTLLLPLAIGLVWLATWLGTDRTYTRSFDTTERLLTQGRVLIDYMRWTIFPNLSQLTLYHDDIEVSKGLWSPRTTLPALLGLFAVMTYAIWARRRRPLFALGILFFFAGHSLTSTVIPLMLAFEHRNYFPSIGLLLSLASVIGIESRLLQLRLQWLAFGAFFLFYAGTTHLRALEWSNPVRLASSEAAKRPNSVDAQYDYARTLIRAANERQDPQILEAAMAHLQAKRSMPGSGLLFDHAILILQARHGEPEDIQLWVEMERRAKTNPPRASDLSAITALYECMRSEQCPRRFDRLLRVVDAIVRHGKVDANFHSMRGLILALELGDFESARAAFVRAISLMPNNAGIRANYVVALIESGDYDSAQEELKKLRRLGTLGSVDKMANRLEVMIDQSRHRSK